MVEVRKLPYFRPAPQWRRFRPAWGGGKDKDFPDDRRDRPQVVRFLQRSADQGLPAAGRRDQCARKGPGEAVGRRPAGAHRGLQEAGRGRHVARRHPGRGVRHGARGRQARHRPAPLRRAADRRHDPARRLDRRDEDRRRQDPGGDLAGLSECAGRPRRPRRDGQRLPRQARLRVDGPKSTISSASRSASSCTGSTTSSARPPTTATSPTAPTTSSASTICATT